MPFNKGLAIHTAECSNLKNEDAFFLTETISYILLGKNNEGVDLHYSTICVKQRWNFTYKYIIRFLYLIYTCAHIYTEHFWKDTYCKWMSSGQGQTEDFFTAYPSIFKLRTKYNYLYIQK